MITVKATDYLDAYKYATECVHKYGVNEILKRTDEALKGTIKFNTSDRNIAKKETYVHLDSSKGETLEMLEDAAKEIRKHGFVAEVDSLDSENIYMQIFVVQTEGSTYKF